MNLLKIRMKKIRMKKKKVKEKRMKKNGEEFKGMKNKDGASVKEGNKNRKR